MEEKKGARDLYRQNLRGIPFEIETSNGFVFQDSRGMYVVDNGDCGELPKISVFADTLPGAYELGLVALWENGTDVRTHYDKKDRVTGEYLYPPSREAAVTFNIRFPFKEPRVHKLIPGGYETLEWYRQEVVEGIKNSWVVPGDTYWTYTYNQRFTDYNPSINLNAPNSGVLLPKGVDQIEKIIDDLVRDITSKGAQATTWMPTADPGLESNRPCLQRMWFRAYEEKDGGIGLNANWYFRSRDVKAWYMNFWALSAWASNIGERLSTRLKKPVKMRKIKDGSDSLHFYGSYFKEFQERDYVRIKHENGFEKRVMDSNDERFVDVIEEEKKKLDRNHHYSLNIDSQKRLAERIARDPNASERDKKFVRDFFPEFLK